MNAKLYIHDKPFWNVIKNLYFNYSFSKYIIYYLIYPPRFVYCTSIQSWYFIFPLTNFFIYWFIKKWNKNKKISYYFSNNLMGSYSFNNSITFDNNLSAEMISSNFSMFTYGLISLIFLSSLFIFLVLFYIQFNYRPIFPIFAIFVLINFIISFFIFIIATLNYQVFNTVTLENIAILVSIKLFLMPFLALTAYLELLFKFKITNLRKTI
jgi:hypothetical protein